MLPFISSGSSQRSIVNSASDTNSSVFNVRFKKNIARLCYATAFLIITKNERQFELKKKHSLVLELLGLQPRWESSHKSLALHLLYRSSHSKSSVESSVEQRTFNKLEVTVVWSFFLSEKRSIRSTESDYFIADNELEIHERFLASLHIRLGWWWWRWREEAKFLFISEWKSKSRHFQCQC